MLDFFSFLNTLIFSSLEGLRPKLRVLGALILPLLILVTPSSTRAEGLSSLAARTHLDKTAIPELGQGDRIIINRNTLAHLASHGRIAAVAKQGSAAESREPSTTGKRRAWRKRYSAAVSKILKVDEKIRSIHQKIRSLEDRAARSRSGKAQFHIEDQIDVQRSRIEELKRQRHDLENALNHVVREARREGAQPGWFRDLPHP